MYYSKHALFNIMTFAEGPGSAVGPSEISKLEVFTSILLVMDH